MTTRGFSILREPTTEEEPVDLDMLKKYVSIAFSAHNDLLDELLSEAREEVEKFLCHSLVESTITVRWEELTSRELPYGPVKEIISVTGPDSPITGHTIEGLIGSFVTIKANRSEPTVIKYLAGYPAEIPKPIKLAIMKRACEHFTDRTGNVLVGRAGVETLPNNWKSACRSYRRMTWTS